MATVFNCTLVGLFLVLIVVIQSKPLLESSASSDENQSTKTSQQLYEIYQNMRADPRLAAVSNKDLVLYIHRNFVNANHQIDSIKSQSPQRQQLEETD